MFLVDFLPFLDQNRSESDKDFWKYWFFRKISNFEIKISRRLLNGFQKFWMIMKGEIWLFLENWVSTFGKVFFDIFGWGKRSGFSEKSLSQPHYWDGVVGDTDEGKPDLGHGLRTEKVLDYTRSTAGQGWPLWELSCGRRLVYANLTWLMCFDLKKMRSFCFYTVYMGPIWVKYQFLLVFSLGNRFYFFSEKKQMVTITRYQITFWIFDFSLLDILPKYIITQKSCHACDMPSWVELRSIQLVFHELAPSLKSLLKIIKITKIIKISSLKSIKSHTKNQ